MARTVRDAQLETRTARARLAPRAEPYWRSIDQGAHLGYYSGRRGGSWVARLYLGGRYRKTTLGITGDVTDADGVAILSFSQAQARALLVLRGDAECRWPRHSNRPLHR